LNSFGGSPTAPKQPSLASFLSGGKNQKGDRKVDKENDHMELDKADVKADVEDGMYSIIFLVGLDTH
jgi:hypothetical protein